MIGLELILPSPLKVLTALFEKAATADFLIAAGLSLLRIAVGFLLGTLVGGLLAVLMRVSKVAKALFSPILHVVKAAPVASFIILALVWFKTDILPVFISFLMVVPVVCANVSEGIAQTDRKLLEVARIYRFGKEDLLRGLAPVRQTLCRQRVQNRARLCVEIRRCRRSYMPSRPLDRRRSLFFQNESRDRRGLGIHRGRYYNKRPARKTNASPAERRKEKRCTN